MQHLLALQDWQNNQQARFGYQLVLVTEGRLSLHCQREYDLIEGDLALLPNALMYTLAGAGQAKILAFCGHCLALEKGHSLIAPFRLVRFSDEKVVRPATSQLIWLKQLFEKISDAQHEAFEGQYEVLRSQLILVLNEVRSLYPTGSIPQRAAKVEQALLFIESNYQKVITLQNVADHVHWSGPHLANKLKAQTGRSVGEWLQTFRLADACTQLSHGNKHIEVIAESVGYQDTTHFIRHFKRYYRHTPAAWRKINS